jgi:electron transport complex protein RnfC
MMGVAQFSVENPVIKQTNALLAFNEVDSLLPEESTCLRCGKCVEACPMNLLPLFINAYAGKRLFEETDRYSPMSCIECGCCSYVCPAKRHLVQSIQYAKAELRKRTQP